MKELWEEELWPIDTEEVNVEGFHDHKYGFLLEPETHRVELETHHVDQEPLWV